MLVSRFQRITSISQKFSCFHADIYISHADYADCTESTSLLTLVRAIRNASLTFHLHSAGNPVTRILCEIRVIRVRQKIFPRANLIRTARGILWPAGSACSAISV